MASILTQVCQDKTFIERLQKAIIDDLMNQDANIWDYQHGQIQGNVTAYDIISIISEISFDNDKLNHNIEDLIWSIELEFEGEATIGYTNLDGEDDEKTLTGLGSTSATITFPSNTLALENIQDIICNIEFELDSSAYLDEEHPLDELNNDARERESELYSMSEDRLRHEVIRLEKEIAELKKQMPNSES